jgi:hypothetical protein
MMGFTSKDILPPPDPGKIRGLQGRIISMYPTTLSCLIHNKWLSDRTVA